MTSSGEYRLSFILLMVPLLQEIYCIFCFVYHSQLSPLFELIKFNDEVI